LGASRLARLVEGIREACPHLEELSCEANPDSLTDEVIDAAVGSGVTRLSVGVQSLEDVELERLGRLHTAVQAKERVGVAVASGLDVSVDLMCAIPSQTTRSWDRTLRDVVSLGVGHVSVYPLSIEEGTPLGRAYADVDPPWNDEDVQAERMERAAAV
jgi:oxygen-independent coproporphyrinogen-3 oxidase